MHFSVLWTVFEAQVLKSNASAKSISQVVEKWEKQGKLKLLNTEEPLAYWTARYIEDGNPSYHFDQLHLRNNDNPELVLSVLKKEAVDPSSVASALLIIVYRFRNNLFHGAKWAYGVQGQLVNFAHACSLLMQSVEIHDHHEFV